MEKIKPIGAALSPILAEIEDTLWEHEATLATKPEFEARGFRAAIKIFACVMLDALYSKATIEKSSLAEMEELATACGNDIRALVQKYTGIDSVKLYDKERNASREENN